MVIKNIEKGSPAEKTGKLKVEQVIESINGQVFKDRDPRMILGDLVTEAEATDGKILLKIQGQGEVLVNIPVMGRYRETWPLKCPKSDKIVRQLAELHATFEKPRWGSVLFLLSTGEERDLEVARRWMNSSRSRWKTATRRSSRRKRNGRPVATDTGPAISRFKAVVASRKTATSSGPTTC